MLDRHLLEDLDFERLLSYKCENRPEVTCLGLASAEGFFLRPKTSCTRGTCTKTNFHAATHPKRIKVMTKSTANMGRPTAMREHPNPHVEVSSSIASIEMKFHAQIITNRTLNVPLTNWIYMQL